MELVEEDRKAGISMCKVLDYRETRGGAKSHVYKVWNIVGKLMPQAVSVGHICGFELGASEFSYA